MNKSIALLSGKGGSGKTTFALALANLLSSCKIKVLIVDCDLITNGATYFYEDRLYGDNQIISFFDALYSDGAKGTSPMEIVPDYFYFVPSICSIASKITEIRPFDSTVNEKFGGICSKWKEEYDVILFDCSAGYSDVLPYVLPEADISLVVLESDKVSMAAMRSLYLKLGPILNSNKNFYQIFNKVRPEDVEDYKGRDGTFFTNIGAIGFDWSIRDAFAVANVPTLDNTGIAFGMQLNSICTSLFAGSPYLSKLNQYGIRLSLRKTQMEQEKTRASLISYQDTSKSDTSDQLFYERSLKSRIPSIIVSIIAFIVSIIGIFAFFTGDKFFAENIIDEIVPLIGIVVFALVLFSFLILDRISDKRSYEYDRKKKEMKLQAFKDTLALQDETIRELKKQLKEFEEASEKQSGVLG